MVFFEICSPKEEQYGFNHDDINYLMPADQYIGGRTRHITFYIQDFLCTQFQVII